MNLNSFTQPDYRSRQADCERCDCLIFQNHTERSWNQYFFYVQICKHVWYSCCSNSDISNYLIVDLEWAVAVVRAAHVVEPPEHDGIRDGVISKSYKICQPFLCATLAAMASTKQTHHLKDCKCWQSNAPFMWHYTVSEVSGYCTFLQLSYVALLNSLLTK